MKKLSMDELGRISEDEFKASPKNQLAIVLDNVRSLNNVGSAFRTADAFLLQKIALCGITGKPPHRDITKTALGATETVDWQYYANTIEAVEQLKKEGFTIVAVEQTDNSIMLNDFMPQVDLKYALVFGNEVFGVEDEVLHKSDLVLEIPQYGTKHSLNISVSVGIVVWDLVAKLKSGG